MAVGLPAKTTYVDGDVFSASDINDTNGTLNLVGQTNNFYAGKNKIINGDFGIWQRGTSFASPASASFAADRFDVVYNGTGATRTISQQTFTAGTAPVSGYEGTFFLRWDNTVAGASNTVSYVRQNIEDVRTFAGQTITLSYWAKASASVTAYGVPTVRQGFGSGGSSEVTTNFSGTTPTYTTSWQRFAFIVVVPSVAGKTIGASSTVRITLPMPVGTTFTVDMWGVQLEAGSVATAFQTATGTIQGELAACQRYYFEQTATYRSFLRQTGDSFRVASVKYPVVMRVAPSVSATFAVEGGSSGSVSTIEPFITNTELLYNAGNNTSVVNFSAVKASAEL
jgi:hypothetical protein